MFSESKQFQSDFMGAALDVAVSISDDLQISSVLISVLKTLNATFESDFAAV